ncbi:MAG TPA: hypothetical protein VHJ20_21910 [Polyangia bacterium]|nr:hypothetical protein [Polyangia bacterium]
MKGSRFAALALVVLGAGCGSLPDPTTVRDLRVLAVKAEPAGFLVPPDDAKSLTTTDAKLTALVVDPMGQTMTLDVTAVGCPDFIDTITSASGKGSKLCPDAATTNALPKPLDTLLATSDLPDSTAMPIDSMTGSPIEYGPTATYGVSADKLDDFFSLATKNDPVLDSDTFRQSVQYNRDFGMDAIVGFTFGLGTEQATALKRIVYWPLLPDADTANVTPLQPDDPPRKDCPDTQVANQNPVLTRVDLYRHLVEGKPTDLYADAVPTVSLSAKDELYVEPVWDPASIEKYYLRSKDGNTGAITTQCHHEQLTFNFFATAGTFSPADRTSELPPFLDKDSVLRTDSKYGMPGIADVPASGVVTIWVTARDERAGQTWSSRTIKVVP